MLNPVFRRETRTALRTWKSTAVLTLYVLVLAGAAAVYLNILIASSAYNGFLPQRTVSLYIFLAGFQLGLMMLIVPALTGGAISGEKERQTLDLMLVTKMSTTSIILGKLVSSLAIVVLMIVAAIPVFAAVLYYGGVTPLDLLTLALFTITSAMLIGSISIFLSTLFKKTIPAIVVTYILMLLLSIGTLLFYAISRWFYDYMLDYSGDFPNAASYVMLMGNPFMGFVSVIDSQLGTDVIPSITSNYGNSGFDIFSIPLWLTNAALNIIFTALFVLGAGRLLQPVKALRR